MAKVDIQTRFAAALDKSGAAALPHLGLAVSGGVDSIAMAHLARGWAQSKGVALHAFTVDHRLRDSSAADAARVAATLQGLGIPCDILVWEQACRGGGLQARARDARYRLLRAAALARGCAAVLLGHQADDQGETFWMRLADGSGLAGLAGMRGWRDDGALRWLRPLLDVTRDEIAAYVAENALPVIEDPANKNDGFTRVRLRGFAQQLAAEGLTPARLAATVQKLRDAEDALDCVTEDLWQKRAKAFGGAWALDLAGWHDMPVELRRRLLQRALRRMTPAAYPPAHDQLSFLAEQAARDGFSAHSLGGCIFRRRRGELWVLREPAALPDALPLAGQGDALLWDHRVALSGLGAWPDAALGGLGLSGVEQLSCAGALWTGGWEQAPALLRQGVPALWQGEKLLAVPHLSWRAAPHLPAPPQVG